MSSVFRTHSLSWSWSPSSTGASLLEQQLSYVNNVLTHSLLTCPVYSALTAFLDPDDQPPLVPLSLNNNYPSMAPFQSPIHASSTSIEQNVSIQENLTIAISKNDCDFQQQAHGMISEGNFKLFVQFQKDCNCHHELLPRY